ncbi:hypothetical protein J1605_011580 [Eschrichtius robustus]|uniref:Uncharacterized protein n=1 Tax=Eschrichtius robustus TaxID=9764 RepID=A0AB34GL53_ESCRO|nr:hypothetical protein J1605_011580 [Eschrichtius robustus]
MGLQVVGFETPVTPKAWSPELPRAAGTLDPRARPRLSGQTRSKADKARAPGTGSSVGNDGSREPAHGVRGGAETEPRARGGAAGAGLAHRVGRARSRRRGVVAPAGGRHAAGQRPGCGSVAGLAAPPLCRARPAPRECVCVGVVPGTGWARPGAAQPRGAGVNARGGAQALTRDWGLRRAGPFPARPSAQVPVCSPAAPVRAPVTSSPPLSRPRAGPAPSAAASAEAGAALAPEPACGPGPPPRSPVAAGGGRVRVSGRLWSGELLRCAALGPRARLKESGLTCPV